MDTLSRKRRPSRQVCDRLQTLRVQRSRFRLPRTYPSSRPEGALGKNEDFRNSRTTILEDLTISLTEWKLEGYHVILCMDANKDVREGEVYVFMQKLSMREVILELHLESSPPATYNRNNQRQPIDGLWATPGINISQGGYLACGDGCLLDHRGLWFKVEFAVAFGHRPPNFAPPQQKRLKAKDPRAVK
jgi:hypothetical protein